LHATDGLVVRRIRHATDFAVGFYNLEGEGALNWGYVLNLHHPDQSAWRHATDIAGTIDGDLPVVSRLADIGLRVAFLADDTLTVDPRAVALAVGDVKDVEFEGTRLDGLQQWLAAYRIARLQVGQVQR
jgi:hypothetical protein